MSEWLIAAFSVTSLSRVSTKQRTCKTKKKGDTGQARLIMFESNSAGFSHAVTLFIPACIPGWAGRSLGGKRTCLSNARVTKPPPGLQGDFEKTGSLDSPGCSLSHCSLSGVEWRVTLNSWSSGHSLPSAKITGMGHHT